MRNLALLLAGCFGLLSLCFAAQQEDHRAYHFDSQAGAIVPFELTKNIIYFQIRLRGSSRVLWFNLDSGAGSTYMDSAVARDLGLQPHGSGTVHGAGSGAVPVQYVDSVTFELPGLESMNHRVNLTDLKQVNDLREEDGFLGYDFLSRYVVVVDYAAQKMTIYDPSDFKYTGRGQALAVHFKRHWPYVSGIIKVKGLAAQSGEFLVDCGSGDAVDHPAILKSTVPLRKIKTGVGLGLASEGALGRAEYLQLGRFRLQGPITSCCSPNPDDRQVIGGEVLRRFTVIFDYPHQQIILEPNRNFGEPFPNA